MRINKYWLFVFCIFIILIVSFKSFAQDVCPPNSYLKDGLCYCNDGFVWNKEQNKCITYDEDCRSFYGEHSISGKGDKDHAYLCYCEEGYVWNKDKTKCITYTEGCRLVYGDHVVGRKGDTNHNSYCDCEKGYVWNKDGTKCITYDEYCRSFYGKHSISGKGDENHLFLCYCETGYVWNENKTKCIEANEWCQNKFGPNSYLGSDQKCHCKDGYAWNKKGNYCATYTEACKEIYGENVIGSKGKEQDIASCDCINGYVWNFNQTQCITRWEKIKEYYDEMGPDIIRCIFLGLIPILLWIFIFSIPIEKILKKNIFTKRSLILFLGGIILTPLVWIIETIITKLIGIDLNNTLSLWILIIYYLIIAIIEELGKFFTTALILKRNKYFDEAIDAMIYLIVLALGFALVENILATTQDLTSSNWLLSALQTLSLRFVGANLLHILCSGFIGFFWALSLIKKNKKYLIIGLVLGILLHTSFNVAIIRLSESFYFIIFTLIVLLCFFLISFKTLLNIS